MTLTNTMITAHMPLLPPRTRRSIRSRSTTANTSNPIWITSSGTMSSRIRGSKALRSGMFTGGLQGVDAERVGRPHHGLHPHRPA